MKIPIQVNRTIVKDSVDGALYLESTAFCSLFRVLYSIKGAALRK